MIDDTQTVWGIHAGRLGEADALFKQGFVALGWHEMGNLSSLPPSREAFKQKVTQTYPNDKPASVPGSARQLFRFLHEMKPGDIAVYRSKIDRQIHVGRITGPYRYDPSHDPRYPNQRTTDWLRTVPITQVSQGALYELGAALTLFQIRNYADDFLRALNATAHPQPVAVEANDTIVHTTVDIEENTRDFVLKRLAQELKGHPFAAFVAHLLGAMGYRTRVSPEGPDGGIDIVAHKDELGFEPPIVKVQVKSTLSNLGQPDVSALIGTLSTGEFGLVVTLGGFTNQAKAFARNKANLRLIDGAELVDLDLVLAHYEQFDSRYKGLLPLKRVYVPDPDVDAE